MAAEIIEAYRDSQENNSTNNLAGKWKVNQKTLDDFLKKPTNARLSTLSWFLNAWDIDAATFYAMHPSIADNLAEGEINPVLARLERVVTGPTLVRLVENSELAAELGVLDPLSRGISVFLSRLKSSK